MTYTERMGKPDVLCVYCRLFWSARGISKHIVTCVFNPRCITRWGRPSNKRLREYAARCSLMLLLLAVAAPAEAATASQLPTCTMSASPLTVASGKSVTLSWSSARADSFAFYQAIGAGSELLGNLAPTAGGSRVITPPKTLKYIGLVKNKFGIGACTTLQITVATTPPPPKAEYLLDGTGGKLLDGKGGFVTK